MAPSFRLKHVTTDTVNRNLSFDQIGNLKNIIAHSFETAQKAPR